MPLCDRPLDGVGSRGASWRLLACPTGGQPWPQPLRAVTQGPLWLPWGVVGVQALRPFLPFRRQAGAGRRPAPVRQGNRAERGRQSWLSLRVVSGCLPGQFGFVGAGGGGVLGELAVAQHVEPEPRVAFVFEKDLEVSGFFPVEAGCVVGEAVRVEVVG